eukprot:scaffold3618_cov129-Cylindrotheca_fusiformis.AAC.15
MLSIIRNSRSTTRRGGTMSWNHHVSLTTATTTTRQCATTTTTTTATMNRLVVSRRAWKAHLEKFPPKQKTKPETNAGGTEKPWPRNVRIAGYVAAAITIPYTTVWFIVSNPNLREIFFSNNTILDRLRTHFGTVEWDAQSYVDRRKTKIINPGYYQLPQEWSFRERQMEEEIKKRNSTKVLANLYLFSSTTSDDHEEITKQVDASTLANKESLQKAFHIGLSTTTATTTTAAEAEDIQHGSATAMAIDFEDYDDDDEQRSSSKEEVELYGLEDYHPPMQNENDNDVTRQMRKRTHTFSNWYHVSTTTPSSTNNQSSNKLMSDVDLEVSRLEYTVAELEKDLNDPNCTRDIDDMTNELKEARRDLSKLKWKRRLGLQ